VLPLEVRCSILPIQRNDPAESFLVQMLLHSEPDLPGQPALTKLKDPMAFAVFGRGRARFGLVGGGINADTIGEDVAFLTGPCTCTIKEENPGFDLLLAADWESSIGERLVQDRELPPLTGLGGPKVPEVHDVDPPETAPTVRFVNLDRDHDPWKKLLDDFRKSPDIVEPAVVAKKRADAEKRASTQPVPESGADPERAADGATGNKEAAKTDAQTAAAEQESVIFRNTIIALVAGIVIVGGVYLLARRRTA
jgi:hypothetical protein